MSFFDEIDRREKRSRLYVLLLAVTLLGTSLMVPGVFLASAVFVMKADLADLLWVIPYTAPAVLTVVTLGALVDRQGRRTSLRRQWQRAGTTPPSIEDPVVPLVLRNVAQEMQIAAVAGVELHVEMLADHELVHVDIQSDGGTALVRLSQRALDELSRDALQAVLAYAVARAQEPRVKTERLLLSFIDGLAWLRACGVMVLMVGGAFAWI